MPVACPLSLGRRAPQASVIHHVRQFAHTTLNSHNRSFLGSGHVKKSQHGPSSRVPASLQAALEIAARNNRAPALHTHSDDVSFVSMSGRKPDILHDDRRSSSASSTPRLLRNMLARRVLVLAESEAAVVKSFPMTAQESQSLRSAGFGQADVDHWLDIVTTHDSYRAARLLTAGPCPPSFVYEYLLRREHIRPDALRLLIQYLPRWHQSILDLSTQHSLSSENVDAVLQSPVFRAFLRLLRHCRRVWPEAIAPLATFLTRTLRLSYQAQLQIDQGNVSAEPIARLTHMYNRGLNLLAEPASVLPFKSIPHQEAAQAIFLKYMAEHNPPLVINREGYRGVTRVQLASKKTHTEQEWARLKSPSWPPWKEDRTGMDAHIGLEHGTSRAHHVLNRMQEAGYPLSRWDQIALIYAGWDTDSSPTVQTRVILRGLSDLDLTPQIWVARIRTTRTAQQAWACFLAYQDEKLPPNERVYHAMFEVMVQERKRLRLGPENIGHEAHHDGENPLYPGDTKEVGSPPASAHQLTYVRTEMPPIRQLFEHMQEDNLCPSDDTVALLMGSAEDLEEGLLYLRSATKKHHAALNTLFCDVIDHGLLSALPDSVFTAYIDLLCRFPRSPLEPLLVNKFNYGKWNIFLRQPLARAIYLLVKQRRQHLPAWNTVFRRLARRIAPALGSSWRAVHLEGRNLESEAELYDKIFAFLLARQVIETMQENDMVIDIEAFRHVCIVAENAAIASNTVLTQLGNDPKAVSNSLDAHLITKAKEVFNEAPNYLRRQFLNMAKGREDTSMQRPEDSSTISIALPHLLKVPHPAVIHAYIRALGSLRDHDGLEELVRWMIEYKDEITERRALDRKGVRMLRRALASLRMFLSKWFPFSRSTDKSQIDRIAAMLDSIEDWGGWPSREDVDVYMAAKKRRSEDDG